MSAKELVQTNLGFFLYLQETPEQCSRLIVPKMEAVPHENQLFLPRNGTSLNNDLLNPRPDGPFLVIDMRGRSMSFNRAGAARVGRRTSGSWDDPDFDWVPQMKHTMCGISLHPNWENSEGVDSIITLGGGQLNAVQDNHTCARVWSWELCDKTQHSQRVTTITEYRPLSADAVTIHFFTTVGRTPISTAVIDTNVATVGMWYSNMPVEEINGRMPTREEIEFTHVQAMMRVSTRNEGELRLPVKSETPTKCTSGRPGRVPPIDFFEPRVKRHNGTIECSGQSTPPPDPEP